MAKKKRIAAKKAVQVKKKAIAPKKEKPPLTVKRKKC